MAYMGGALALSLIALCFVTWRLLEVIVKEREMAASERAMLLQRIQAPELAIASKAQEDMNEFEPPRLHIAYDADDEWAEFNGVTND